MTKLTDAELAEKTAEMMGWTLLDDGVCQTPQGLRNLNNFDPCNDWNDSVATAKALPENAKMILSDDLEEFFHNTYLDDLTPRKLTESILKAAGVDVGE